ncbi:hypothetical protein ACJMK2_010653 [Sinanodonta woodiana]|uniref:Uncharacterized protein n=1 Tax=Sinanodonta woodiana TaxID=1069815 RepID=A0ABD3VG20_SINWO
MASSHNDMMETLQEAMYDMRMVEELLMRMDYAEYNLQLLKMEINNVTKTKDRLREQLKQEKKENEDDKDNI